MVAHLFERQRVQNRGVPWGTPAMRAIRDVDDWQNAELVRKKTEACLVGIVFGAEEDQMSIAPIVQDADGNRVEQFEPGLIAYSPRRWAALPSRVGKASEMRMAPQ